MTAASLTLLLLSLLSITASNGYQVSIQLKLAQVASQIESQVETPRGIRISLAKRKKSDLNAM